MKARFSPRTLLNLAFMAVAVYGLIAAWNWPLSTRLFPQMAAAGLLVFSAVELVRDLIGVRREGRVMDFQFAEGIAPAIARRRTVIIWGWLLGLLLVIWLVGFPIAIPVAIFGYLRFQGRETWAVSIGLAVLTYLFFEVVFLRMLHIAMPASVFFG